MPWLTQLADVARRTGFEVVEEPGWRTRGHGEMYPIQGVVCHHTAGWNDLHVVRDGRPGLDGPLSQFWLSRRAKIHVVAAGKSWQNAPSTSRHHQNSNSIGIEAENDGKTPWPADQLRAFKALSAELCNEFGLTASRVCGHKEVNTSKVDPHSLNMHQFRVDVAHLMTNPANGVDDMPPPKDLWQYELKVPYGDQENPTWQAGNILANHGTWLRKISGQLDAARIREESQTAVIRELATALGNAGGVDVDAFLARIEQALDRVTVQVSISPEPEE
ncbi:peptidoglycan recognition protein family protein [Herbidospora mongoliensis]|uniref:peptidoglycan recognition protein family protein n=1 Tax=Herbidospora mongoliensis TaxID=688067 RepID=UPI00082E0ED8|nr:peptidoglycan recognition family protein [Herbidospora mongoliensis]